MIKIPISLCLFTSTKGHFGIKTRYKETVRALSTLIPLSDFANLVAHIKISPGERDIAAEMSVYLQEMGFQVYTTLGEWSHGSQSHQSEYIADMMRVYNLSSVQQTPFILAMEDDWIVRCYEKTMHDYIHKAIEQLTLNPDLIQIRFPRFTNEKDRINGLKQKHGIEATASEVFDGLFLHSDFSANPSIFRSRDIRTALVLLPRLGLPIHAEHGLSIALKVLSRSQTPFACFDPTTIRIGHIGCPVGEEDNLSKPLIS